MTRYIIQFLDRNGVLHNYQDRSTFAVEFLYLSSAEKVMTDLIKLNYMEWNIGSQNARYSAWQIKDSTGEVVKSVQI